MHDEWSDINAIRTLKSRYFRFLDGKNWESLATIFCQDAIFDARLATTIGPNSGGDSEWYAEGHGAIVDFIRSVVEHRVTVHHGHNHEIEILDGEHARGVIALEDWIWDQAGADGSLIMHGWGHYRENYRREVDGWRIHRSTLTRLNLLTS